MTGVFIKRGTLDADMHIGRTLCEDESRDLGQGMPKNWQHVTRNQGRVMEEILPHSLRRNQNCSHLDLGLLASRPSILLLKATQFVVLH